MKYAKLGNSDIEVSRLCVGCMSFGEASTNYHAWTLNAEESEVLVKRALELDINFFDTANVYSAHSFQKGKARGPCLRFN